MDLRPVGIHTISAFMKQISQDAELSRGYTNQCVGRATSITVLDSFGYSPSEIIALSRHHDEKSVEPYLHNGTMTKKRHMVETMQKTLLATLDPNNNMKQPRIEN